MLAQLLSESLNWLALMALMQLNDKLLKDDYGSNTSVANKIVEIIEDSDELRLGAEGRVLALLLSFIADFGAFLYCLLQSLYCLWHSPSFLVICKA